MAAVGCRVEGCVAVYELCHNETIVKQSYSRKCRIDSMPGLASAWGFSPKLDTA